MLGESMRRRRRDDRARRARRGHDESLGAVIWGGVMAPGRRAWRWVGIVAGATLLAFGIGYGVAVFVLFPLPEEGAVGVPVPELVGRSVDEAEDELQAAGLQAARTLPLVGSGHSPGTVVAQSPLSGQQLPRGAVVELAISAEARDVRVPDVVGFDVERATDLLSRLGFGVARMERVDEAPAGEVIDVRPTPGARTTLPTSVQLTVSTGPPEPLLPESLDIGFDSLMTEPEPTPMPTLPDANSPTVRDSDGREP